MSIGWAERNLSVLSPQGSLNWSDRFVGSCISDQGGEVRGLGLNRDDSRARVLESEQNTSHADMSAGIHDGTGAEIRYPGIIRLALEDENVPVRTKIRGIDSEVDAVIRLKRDNRQFAGSPAQAKRTDRVDSAASARFVIPFQSLPKAH